MKDPRNMSDPESRDFWEFVERAAENARRWRKETRAMYGEDDDEPTSGTADGHTTAGEQRQSEA